MHPVNYCNLTEPADRLILTAYRNQTINREIIGQNRASTFPHPVVNNGCSFLQRSRQRIQNCFPNLYLNLYLTN